MLNILSSKLLLQLGLEKHLYDCFNMSHFFRALLLVFDLFIIPSMEFYIRLLGKLG